MMSGLRGWVAGTVRAKEKYDGVPMIYIKEDGDKSGYLKGYWISTWLNEDGWNELKARRKFKLLEEQPELFGSSNS